MPLQNFVGINYDSSLLKLFLLFRDYFFEKGESLIHADNAEDAVWWNHNYAALYGFTRTGRKDKSMAINTLDKPTQRAIREKLFNYIVKMDKYGIKGIHSEKYANPVYEISALVGGFLVSPSEMYEGNVQEKVEAYYRDSNMSRTILNIYTAYDHFISKQTVDERDQYFFNYFRYRLLSEIIMRKIAAEKDFKLHECDEYIEQYISNVAYLLNWIKSPDSSSDSDSKYTKAAFIDSFISDNPDYVSNIINSNINQQCTQHSTTSGSDENILTNDCYAKKYIRRKAG